jgi:hypothetical protein
MVRGVRPFATHGYEISWWSLMVLLDGVVWIRARRSPIAEAPFRFLLLSLWSVAFWFFFEILNLRLRNWHYIFVGPGEPERWLGSFLCFATVIPGVLLFAEAFPGGGGFITAPEGGAEPEPGSPPPRAPEEPVAGRSLRLTIPLQLLGAGCLLLPLVWPRLLYPLVWGGLVLLLDPLNHRRGARSLLFGRGEAHRRLLFHLLLAGGAAGLFWEGLNYWARVKWIYTVPFFEELKLFEMPLLGFLGFLPFALECFVVAETLSTSGLLPAGGSRPGPARRAALLASALGASLLAAALALPAMDRVTFASLYPMVGELVRLSPSERAQLEARGIEDCFQLRSFLAARGESSSPLGRAVELVLHAGIGAEKAQALEVLGIHTVDSLASSDPEDLWRKLEGVELRHRPLLAEVRYWVRKAERRVEPSRR